MQKLIENGYEIVDFHEIADFYIINTCTVTNMADRKSRKMLRSVKHRAPNSIVVACGCYAQIGKEELKKIPEIDLILGTNEKNNLVEQIEEYLKKIKKIENVTNVMNQMEFLDFGSVTYTEKTRAFIKIQDGCNRFCSYCIIPYARGHIRSRKLGSIVEEVKELAKKGIKEVVLTGIHLASYGKDLKMDITLVEVVEEIQKIESIDRIRLGSLEPTFLTNDVIKRFRKCNKLCDHFHLSLQSGCNSTLKRMNRHYTTEEFSDIVKAIRKYYPDVAFTTDIIVGFPGETDEEFCITYNFLKQIDFYQMHVFQYSPRKGTKAANMQNQISNNKKEERSKALIELSKQNEKRQNSSYISKKVSVLWEENDGEYIKGHTTNYKEIYAIPNEITKENIIQNVLIEKMEREKLIGRIID